MSHKAFEEHIAHCAGISAQPARDPTTQKSTPQARPMSIQRLVSANYLRERMWLCNRSHPLMMIPTVRLCVCMNVSLVCTLCLRPFNVRGPVQ